MTVAAVAVVDVPAMRRAAAVAFPVTGCAPSQSVRVLWGGVAAATNLVPCAAPASNPFYMVQCDGGPPAIELDAPD